MTAPAWRTSFETLPQARESQANLPTGRRASVKPYPRAMATPPCTCTMTTWPNAMVNVGARQRGITPSRSHYQAGGGILQHAGPAYPAARGRSESSGLNSLVRVGKSVAVKFIARREPVIHHNGTAPKQAGLADIPQVSFSPTRRAPTTPLTRG